MNSKDEQVYTVCILQFSCFTNTDPDPLDPQDFGFLDPDPDPRIRFQGAKYQPKTAIFFQNPNLNN